MDRGFRGLLAAFVGLGSFAIGLPTLNAAQGLNHPGRVVEMGANRPLSVDVKAWPESRQTGREGDCPVYGKAPLDSTQSVPADGQFRLRIEATKPTYTTTYCASGYYPRADRDVPNKEDGSPVIPNPVEMYSRKNDQTAYTLIVRSKTASLLNDLAYLQSINPEGFNKVVAALGSDIGTNFPMRQKAVFTVRDLILEWRK